jgi:hypothetical protein
VDALAWSFSSPSIDQYGALATPTRCTCIQQGRRVSPPKPLDRPAAVCGARSSLCLISSEAPQELPRTSILLFFYSHGTTLFYSHGKTQTLTIRTHTHLYKNTYANPPYEHLRRTEHRQIWRFSKSPLAPRRRRQIWTADLQIFEVTTGASWSTGTSLTT